MQAGFCAVFPSSSSSSCSPFFFFLFLMQADVLMFSFLLLLPLPHLVLFSSFFLFFFSSFFSFSSIHYKSQLFSLSFYFGWVLRYIHRNRMLISDGEPRRATLTFTQLLSSERFYWLKWAFFLRQANVLYTKKSGSMLDLLSGGNCLKYSYVLQLTGPCLGYSDLTDCSLWPGTWFYPRSTFHLLSSPWL